MAKLDSQSYGSDGKVASGAPPNRHPNGSDAAISAVGRPGFVYGLLVVAALLFTMVPTLQKYPSDWIGRNPFYSHGSLVPLLTAYLVFDRWSVLSALPRRRNWFGALTFVVLLWASWSASAEALSVAFSVLIFLTLLAAIWAMVGVHWLRALLAPSFLLSAGLPVWQPLVERLSIPLQRLSIDHAVSLLGAMQFHPLRIDASTLLFDKGELALGSPASGVRVFWAVLVVLVFLIMVSRMHLWANIVLSVSAIVLSYALNVGRIVVAGTVGSYLGTSAGARVMEVGGFIILALCFFLLYRLTKALGWNN